MCVRMIGVTDVKRGGEDLKWRPRKMELLEVDEKTNDVKGLNETSLDRFGSSVRFFSKPNRLTEEERKGGCHVLGLVPFLVSCSL